MQSMTTNVMRPWDLRTSFTQKIERTGLQQVNGGSRDIHLSSNCVVLDTKCALLDFLNYQLTGWP